MDNFEREKILELLNAFVALNNFASFPSDYLTQESIRLSLRADSFLDPAGHAEYLKRSAAEWEV